MSYVAPWSLNGGFWNEADDRRIVNSYNPGSEVGMGFLAQAGLVILGGIVARCAAVGVRQCLREGKALGMDVAKSYDDAVIADKLKSEKFWKGVDESAKPKTSVPNDPKPVEEWEAIEAMARLIFAQWWAKMETGYPFPATQDIDEIRNPQYQQQMQKWIYSRFNIEPELEFPYEFSILSWKDKEQISTYFSAFTRDVWNTWDPAGVADPRPNFGLEDNRANRTSVDGPTVTMSLDLFTKQFVIDLQF